MIKDVSMEYGTETCTHYPELRLIRVLLTRVYCIDIDIYGPGYTVISRYNKVGYNEMEISPRALNALIIIRL